MIKKPLWMRLYNRSWFSRHCFEWQMCWRSWAWSRSRHVDWIEGYPPWTDNYFILGPFQCRWQG